MKKEIKHTTIRNGKLFCLNCGGSHDLQFPMVPDQLSRKTKAFNQLHGDCPPTWKEPEADQSQGVREKAMWWIANGYVGMSSKTIWNCLIGNKNFPVHHPYDPDDFSRCYKLLQAVPEWRNELHRLKPLSKAWSNLVDNWDKLTEMYELNVKTDWKNYNQIGMYEFMQTLFI
jgi:hypothetical protein